MTADPDIIEAAARIIFDRDDLKSWDRRAEGATEWAVEVEREDYRATASSVLAAVAPLIEAAALERDAKHRGLSASETACYRWPEDTEEHKALRAAFVEGAML